MRVFEAGDDICRDARFLAWVVEQGLEPNRIYRMDVGETTATVYEFRLDAKGKFINQNGQVARREPYVVAIKSQPPRAGKL